MKKQILFIAIVAPLLFQSCKKDYTCTCNLTYSNGQIPYKKERTLLDMSKRNAKKVCVDYVEQKSNYTITADCELQ